MEVDDTAFGGAVPSGEEVEVDVGADLVDRPGVTGSF